MPISLEPPRLAIYGDSRYLPPLLVFGNEDHTITDLQLGANKTDPNHQKIQNLQLRADRVDSNNRKTKIKIVSALKLLAFREQHVLVQFWSAHMVGNHQLLTTINQPYGLGVMDERLHTYRRESRNSFVVEKDHEEEDCSPVARVFRRGLPEWTPDVASYLPKHFAQQECAIRCNLHGYLALPVFDLNTWSCVGVLELLTSLKYKSYAYEFQQFCDALQTVDLRPQHAFDFPKLHVPNEHRQKDLDHIKGILKTMCDIHSLPLAQTWAVSQHTSFVSHEKVIEKSCSSFDTRCVGKVCMFTADLPFYVKDLAMWSFREACRVRHLDKSRGFVGKALLSHSLCFSADVTKLSEEEYPLVHNARMNRLTTCFAIFLHSVEANDDYVLEFFLQPDIKDNGNVPSLVQTLKQKIEMASGFELGDISDIQVVGPPTEATKSLSIDPHTNQMSSITTTDNNKMETVTSDSESIMVNIANGTESSANISNQCPSKQIYPDKFSNIITGTENLTGEDFTQQDIDVVDARKNNTVISYPNVSIQKTSDSITDAREKNDSLKRRRKRKTNSLTMEAVHKHLEKPIDQAAKSLGVSRSTLKHFCRDNKMPSWPLPKHSKKTPSRPLPKHNKETTPITALKPPTIAWTKQNLQRPLNSRFSLALFVFLMVRVKRWSCSSKRHGFSGKWWSCGQHSYLPSKSDFILQTVSEITAMPKHTINNIIPYSRVAESTLVHASPKQIVTNISDKKMVTVKATFKEDMIKFKFPTSSGLLELEHEVARRIKLKSRRPRLKYKDEDDDLILLACDADLHQLLAFTATNSAIKLIIVVDD